MSEAPDDPAELTEIDDAGSGRRRRRWALWGTLAVVALAAGTVAVIGPDDGDPPRLPIALGAAPEGGRSAAAPAAADMSLAYVHYVAGDDLPALGGSAAAYRLRGPDEAAVRRLADAFGLEGARLEHHDGMWDVTPQMQVFDDGSWWYSAADATDTKGGAAGSTGSGVAGSTASCPPDAKCADPMPVTTVVPPPPADLPSEGEARALVLDRFRAAGMDVDGADVSVDGPYDGWYVTVEPQIDGQAVSSIGWSATIGSEGAFLGASGTLGRPERLGSYPTIDTRAAIDRLNDGTAWGSGAGYAARDGIATTEAAEATADRAAGPATTIPADAVTETTEVVVPPDTGVVDEPTQIEPMPTEPMPTEPVTPPEPTEVVLHEADRILVQIGATDGSSDQYLVPGYRMGGDDEMTVEVPSVDDESLLPTTTVDPDPTITAPTVTGGCAPVEPGPDGAVPDICLVPPTTPIPPGGEAVKPSR